MADETWRSHGGCSSPVSVIEATFPEFVASGFQRQRIPHHVVPLAAAHGELRPESQLLSTWCPTSGWAYPPCWSASAWVHGGGLIDTTRYLRRRGDRALAALALFGLLPETRRPAAPRRRRPPMRPRPYDEQGLYQEGWCILAMHQGHAGPVLDGRSARQQLLACAPASCSTTKACAPSASTASSSEAGVARASSLYNTFDSKGRAGPRLPASPPRDKASPAHHPGGGPPYGTPARAPAGRVRRRGRAVRPAETTEAAHSTGPAPRSHPGDATERGRRGLPPLGARAADRAGTAAAWVSPTCESCGPPTTPALRAATASPARMDRPHRGRRRPRRRRRPARLAWPTGHRPGCSRRSTSKYTRRAGPGRMASKRELTIAESRRAIPA